MSTLVINWALSSLTGYGIYGLQILMQHMRRGGQGFVLTDHVLQPVILPPPFDRSLSPLLEPASEAARVLAQKPQERMKFDAPVLFGVGNDFAGFRNQERVFGRPNVGCAALEQAVASPQWLEYLKKRFDMSVAISRWNADFMKSWGLESVHLCHQGIDTAVFHPPAEAPKNDRFVLFSGGKFEFRKGQDIVVAAFKRFLAKHPDAQLIAAWQNFSVPEVAPFVEAGHCSSVPQLAAKGSGLAVDAWLLEQGLPQGSFIALPWLASADIAKVLSLCSMAVFPNRSEGGTNLVAMEAIACGVPTYVAANTGQKDLIELIGCEALTQQGRVPCPPGIQSTQDWGESDADEVVAAMERVYANPQAAREKAKPAAEAMKAWDWAPQNEKLLTAIDAFA